MVMIHEACISQSQTLQEYDWGVKSKSVDHKTSHSTTSAYPSHLLVVQLWICIIPWWLCSSASDGESHSPTSLPLCLSVFLQVTAEWSLYHLAPSHSPANAPLGTANNSGFKSSWFSTMAGIHRRIRREGEIPRSRWEGYSVDFIWNVDELGGWLGL